MKVRIERIIPASKVPSCITRLFLIDDNGTEFELKHLGQVKQGGPYGPMIVEFWPDEVEVLWDKEDYPVEVPADSL